MSLESLLNRQNPDGGWPYTHGGSSWTEPTVYAILALVDSGDRDAAQRGVAWLRSVARAYGGWSPNGTVEESNWVTSLVGLLPPAMLGKAQHRSAIEWLLRTAGHETSMATRLR